MANFENANLLTKLKVAVSILVKENLDLRNLVINKYLTIQMIRTSKDLNYNHHYHWQQYWKKFEQLIPDKEPLSNQLREKQKQNHVKFTEHKKHLKKHVDK